MLHSSITFLRDQVNLFMQVKDPLNKMGGFNPVILTEIVDQQNTLIHSGGDSIFLTLVNTEEETVGKSQLPYYKNSEDKLFLTNPDIKLNLYLQFSAFSDDNTSAYENKLKMLDQVVLFFQFRNVFTAGEYPSLAGSGIEKLIVEPVSLTFEQLNHLWATLGAKYLPSVIYKCRMLTFRETAAFPEMPEISEIITKE